jgi:putative ATP-dependent endonuclease of OLD family
MFAAIRRISKNNQVIFTTHSPIMIADIWLTESVRQVRLNDQGETQIESVKIENVIDELGIKYEDVLNPKIVLFVEGEDDLKFYKKLGLDNPKIKIIPTDGFRAIQYFAFIKIITSENVKSTFILLCDGDGVLPAARADDIKKEITKQFSIPPENLDEMLKDKIHVLVEYSIENYLLNESSLKKVFPEIDASSLTSFLEEYKKRYAEQLALVREGKIKLESFQKHMKPKTLFTNFDNEKAEQAYAEAWKGCDTFLKVKGLVAESCKQLGVEGKDFFDSLLECTDLSLVKELNDIKNSILLQLDV